MIGSPFTERTAKRDAAPIATLETLPILQTLPDGVRSLVVNSFVPVPFSFGDVIASQGRPAEALIVIVAGRARLITRDEGLPEVVVGSVGPGETFGEADLLEDHASRATLRASSDGLAMRLDRAVFDALVRVHPQFRTRLERQVAARRVAGLPTLTPGQPPVQRDGPRSPAHDDPGDQDDDTIDGPFAVDGRFVKRAGRTRRFSHVSQIDEADCAVACLAMVCRHFGRPVSLARIRQLVQTSHDGASLRSICHGATELGLAARAVKVSRRNLPQMPLPAIAHWKGNHWVVVVDVTASHVTIADPASSVRRIAAAEFHQQWSGYAALFDYTDAFAHAPVSTVGISWLWRFIRPHTGLLLRALGLAAVVSGLEMVLPVFTQVIVDRVVVDRDASLLNLLMVAMTAVMGFIIVALGLQRYLLSFVAVRVDSASLDFLAARLLALPLSYFSTRRAGDLQRRLEGARQVRGFVMEQGIGALSACVQLLATLALMLLYSPTLTGVFLASIPCYALLMFVSARLLRPAIERLEEAFGLYHSHQIDAIKGIETVKALGGEHTFRALMLAQFHSVARQIFRADFTTMSYGGGLQALTFLSMAFFLWVGAHQVIQGHLTIGGLVAFNTLVALANGPVTALLGIWDEVQRSAVLVNRLNDVLEQEPEQGRDRSRLRPVRDLRGDISLRNLGFRYGGPDAPPILEGITFDVRAGSRIAIVGRSGSGKTTLARCLAGLLEPTDGTILYDGSDLKTLNYRMLRRRIGLVLQDNYLFADTIVGNIAFGEDDPAMERVEWAAGVANAREFIERLPQRYETRIGETGLALSGGQRQRIAIARAVYRRPPVLILDEATSSLDVDAERVVRDNIDSLLTPCTSIVIAHRLSTIRHADAILVLEKGRLVEHGTHEELLERRGVYASLANQQLLEVDQA